MAKLISLDGFVGDTINSFKESVDPVDVLVGATLRKVVGPMIDGKVNELALNKIEFLNSGEYGPVIKKLINAFILAAAAYAVQKGNKRARGHVVGILGIEAVDFVGPKLASMMPSLGGLVEYNGYGLLTQDNAYGLLTQDTAYGAYHGQYSGEPTSAGMAEFAAFSNANTELDPEAEYA